MPPREAIIATDGVWELRVQLCRNLDRQPVEDPTVKWEQEESLLDTVATIHVAAQDSWGAGRPAQVDDRVRFSVWTGLAARGPRGNINRARAKRRTSVLRLPGES